MNNLKKKRIETVGNNTKPIGARDKKKRRKFWERVVAAKKCSTLLSNDERRCIFKNFWEMGTYNLQNSCIFGCLEVKNKGCSTKPRNCESRRSHTVYYHVKSNSSKVQVCKKAFLNIHG